MIVGQRENEREKRIEGDVVTVDRRNCRERHETDPDSLDARRYFAQLFIVSIVKACRPDSSRKKYSHMAKIFDLRETKQPYMTSTLSFRRNDIRMYYFYV